MLSSHMHHCLPRTYLLLVLPSTDNTVTMQQKSDKVEVIANTLAVNIISDIILLSASHEFHNRSLEICQLLLFVAVRLEILPHHWWWNSFNIQHKELTRPQRLHFQYYSDSIYNVIIYHHLSKHSICSLTWHVTYLTIDSICLRQLLFLKDHYLC